MKPLILTLLTLLTLAAIGSTAHAQSLENTAPHKLIHLTPAELQKEIEAFCKEDADQAKQFRTQRALADRCRQSFDESTGKLFAIETALATAATQARKDAEEIARLNQARKTDAAVGIVANVFALGAGILMTTSAVCWTSGADPYLCGFEAAAGGVLAFGVVAFHVWRF